MLQWLIRVAIASKYTASKSASRCFRVLQNPIRKNLFAFCKKIILV